MACMRFVVWSKIRRAAMAFGGAGPEPDPATPTGAAETSGVGLGPGASLLRRLASEPSRTSGCGRGGGGSGGGGSVGGAEPCGWYWGSCSEIFRKMAPTTLVACAASGDVCFRDDQILYEVPRAFIFRERSSALPGSSVLFSSGQRAKKQVWTYELGMFSVRSRQMIMDAMRKS